MSIVLGLEYLANHLFALSTGIAVSELGDHFLQDESGVLVSLKFDWGRFLWDALEMPFLRVTSSPHVPHDIVHEDIIPGPKRVAMTIDFASGIRVVVDRPLAGARGGPYSATFGLAFPQTPQTLVQAPFQWVRAFLMQVYPDAPKEAMVGQSSPTGIPLADKAFPGQPLLPPEDFGLDQIRVTTSYDPVRKEGEVESVELVFSTPENVSPPPFPLGIPKEFLFRGVSPVGVLVEVRLDGSGNPTHAQVDGAILLPNASDGLTALPLQWTARMPALFAGSFDADAEDADPPFPLAAVRETMGDLHWMLDGIDHLLIHRAELTCDLETLNFDFTGECPPDEPVEIAGLACTDVVITFKWRFDRQSPAPRIVVLRGFADLPETTYFRVALVWRKRWIIAIEGNYSSYTEAAEVPLARLVEQLPRYKTPERQVNDSSLKPQILRLDEQRRAPRNDFDELIGE